MADNLSLTQKREEYNKNKQLLKENLDLLLAKYSYLSGEAAEALIEVRKTGYAMLSEVDFLYFPIFLIPLQNKKESDNYHDINIIYKQANSLMASLINGNTSIHEIEGYKNRLANQIKARTGVSGSERAVSILAAFYFALVGLAGVIILATALVALLTTPIGWLSLVPITLGLFGAVLGVMYLTHNIKHAADSGKKHFGLFSTAAEKFTSKLNNLSDASISENDVLVSSVGNFQTNLSSV